MEKAKVYFLRFSHDRLWYGAPSKTQKAYNRRRYRRSGNGREVRKPLKMHFGELGNVSYLRPNYARAVVDVVKELGGHPFLTDCNTMYPGSRKNALEHLACAWGKRLYPQDRGLSPC